MRAAHEAGPSKHVGLYPHCSPAVPRGHGAPPRHRPPSPPVALSACLRFYVPLHPSPTARAQPPISPPPRTGDGSGEPCDVMQKNAYGKDGVDEVAQEAAQVAANMEAQRIKGSLKSDPDDK